MTETLRVRVLGGFAASLGDRALVLKGRKAQALLAFLALSGGAPVSRDRLTGLLWSDRGDEQARGSLRQALAELRRMLGDTDADLVKSERDSVALDGARLDCDALDLDRLAASPDTDDLDRAAALYQGDLLDGVGIADRGFEDWLAAERTRLAERARNAMSDLLERRIGDHDTENAIGTARRLLALDPLQEPVHRALMRLYAESGDRAMALKQYEACRAVLRADLGIEPEAETQALYDNLRKGAPSPQTAEGALLADEPADAPPALPDKPSIAVLPFVNMSGDADQEHFADGITEDIITELSRFRSLFVIARHSSFHYKGKSPRIPDVGRELGVAYVVEGSVRKAGNRVRITAQLIEAKGGKHLWAERYDRDLEDIFAVQDEVASEIVTAVPGHVDIANRVDAERKPANDLSAYDLVLRSETIFYRDWTSLQIKELLEKALEIDPGYARAHGRLANFLAYSIFSHLFGYKETSSLARKHADIALQLDPNDPVVQATVAETHMLIGDHETARVHIEKAIALNPNDYNVMILAGMSFAYLGDHEEGLKWTRLAARRDPYSSNSVREGFFDCYYLAGRYEEAIEQTRGWRNPPPHIHAELAAAYAMLGRMEEARAAAARFKQLDPKGWEATEMRQAQARMCAKQADAERWLEGYRKAGVPV